MKLTKLTAGLLAGCTLLAAAGSALAQDQEPVSATMIIYLDPSVQFFNPVVKGAQDAAAAFNVDLDVQYANNDPVRQNDLIESAVATGPLDAAMRHGHALAQGCRPKALAGEQAVEHNGSGQTVMVFKE